MTHIKIIISVCLLLFVWGCTNDSNGTGARGTNQKAVNTLKQNMKTHREINKRYPPPLGQAELSKLKLYSVKSVSKQGVITLENGPDLILEGVKCSSANQGRITQFLYDEADKVSFIPSTNSKISPIPAYIWYEDLSLMQDPDFKDFVTGPSYPSLNESVIGSGWCTAERTAHNKYYERYRALEEFSK